MHASNLLSSTKRIGTGLSFIIFPIVFVFAFSVHPGLLYPHFLGPSELILRARGADALLHFGHALVMLDTDLLVVVVLHFIKLLDNTAVAWAGFLGGALAVLGSLALAVWLETRIWQEMETIEEHKNMKYITSVERIAIAKGRVEGRVEGESKLLKRQLERRFGALPAWATEKLSNATEPALEAWGEAILTAPTLEAVFNFEATKK